MPRGVKTSEFWLSVAVIVLLQLNQMGLIPTPKDSNVTQIGMAIAVSIYALARAFFKTLGPTDSPSPTLPPTPTTNLTQLPPTA